MLHFGFLTDEYIHMNKINKPAQYNHNRYEQQSDSGLSKFDRYKHQDEDDDEDMDDGNTDSFKLFQ